LIDHKGNLWIGSINGGLEMYDTATASFIHYQNEPDNTFSLSQRSVSALFEDNQNNLWVGTHRGGINLYMPGAQKFNLYRQEARPQSLSLNDVKAFCEDRQDNLWVGTDGGGLNLFDRKNNTFTHYKYNPLDNRSLASDAVLDIMQDSKNDLWISTWSGGLNLFNSKTGTFTRFLNKQDDTSSISSNFVQKTFEDNNSNLWVATYYGGLNLFDRNKKKFTRFLQASPGNYLSGNNVISINEDKKNRIWIGTDDGGLNCYTASNGKIVHYFNNGEIMPDLRVIFIDSKDRIWIGQKGLYLFNESTNTFSLFTDSAGLSTEFIKGMTEDEQGNFWVSTSNGITKFNPDAKIFEKYNTEDGLQGLEFETGSYLKAKNGEMFFGGMNGFNTFYPSNIKTNKFKPPVYITSFQIFNEDMNVGKKNSPLKEDITLTKEIHLSYRQSTFSFNFSALNYTSAENNKYSYKLDGFDKKWNYAGTERKANYTNLNPGEYTFHVRASNNDNVWDDQGASIKIIITPPFWKTTWFTVLLSAFIVACGYIFYRFKRRMEIRKLEEKKKDEINQFQLQFFTNISHEFRTPLTLILGPLEKLMKENSNDAYDHYYNSIQRNVHRLMDLISELMDFRKIETNSLKLRVRLENLAHFLEEIAQEFEEWAEHKHITFTVRNIDAIHDVWFDKQVLEKIVLNLLTNSFKYAASGGNITLEILSSLENFTPSFINELIIKSNYKAKRNFYIRVADNGIGISKDSIKHLFERYFRIAEFHLGSGVGLAFVKSLTFLHKGNIYVYSERHKGTEIIIGIPMGEENYSKNEKFTGTDQEVIVQLESLGNKYEHYLSPKNGNGEAGIEKSSNGLPLEHILIVEDNEELRDFLENCLKPYYRVTTAPDGRSGYNKAINEFPNLIISDVMMPGMNGIQLCKAVKQNIESSHIPIILLTAKDAMESKIEGVESGADFYFSKPLSMELLLATIKNIFEQHKKLRERYTRNYNAQVKDLVNNCRDKEFMEQLLQIIESQLTNPDLDIDYLCNKIGMSRTKLYNKIKQITGQSINDFVRTLRLKKAVEIMTHEDVPFTEVMFRIGIQSQSYFTKAFKKEFGKTPSQFIQELQR
jgi:signal transduction histidine kinase/DNA-binding response OmpR family regulator